MQKAPKMSCFCCKSKVAKKNQSYYKKQETKIQAECVNLNKRISYLSNEIRSLEEKVDKLEAEINSKKFNTRYKTWPVDVKQQFKASCIKQKIKLSIDSKDRRIRYNLKLAKRRYKRLNFTLTFKPVVIRDSAELLVEAIKERLLELSKSKEKKQTFRIIYHENEFIVI